MGYVPETPINSYLTMPWGGLMGDAILYVDNKAYDIPKHKYSNCPNCGAPVKGPICEYCGSILDQAEIDRQEQELVEKQRQYEELLRRWQQSVINAELNQPIMNRMNHYDHEISQSCCDTRTQMSQQSIAQSQVYIPKPVPLVIEEKQTKDFDYELAWVIIAILLIAAPIAAFIAPFLA